MLIMSNMKNLLGDADFEEVERFLGMDTTKFTEEDKTNFIRILDKCCFNIHDYWMEENGRELARAWVTLHDDFVNVMYIKEFTRYMTESFVKWLLGAGRDK
jgi:hypothetical protein